MNLSYNWLRTYLPQLNMSAEQLSELLTDIGLEVEGVETRHAVAGGLEGVVVGKVLTCIKHPNADKLSLTTVDVGDGQAPLSIVCGAPNVAAHQKVLVATIGATLHPTEGEPFKIKKGKIRGEESQGMICAADEIGIGSDHSGIMVLSPDVVVGTPAAVALGLPSDVIFELGLTPNRSDANCYTGVARDVYAALVTRMGYEAQLHLPNTDAFVAPNVLPISVSVARPDLCPRYSGVCIAGLTIAPSPQWLQDRLLAIGERSINNVVDITNFVLHELGQPLHAFDLQRIGGQGIVVDTLADQTPFVSLDGKTILLHPDDLIICDANRQPMCIGGVFGGLHSGVSTQTTSIFLESAHFNMTSIRRTSQRHQLKTSAAKVYERGSDPNITLYALQRAALLMCELAGGHISSAVVDVYPTAIARPHITLPYAQLDRLLGVSIDRPKVLQIVAALNMDILHHTDTELTVSVPTNKVDVLRPVDLIEEIVRIYGLNNIPIAHTTTLVPSYSDRVDTYEVQNMVADLLAANACSEIIGMSIQNSKHYNEQQTDLVRLLSSVNTDLTVLRPNLLFTALDVIRYNQNHRNTDLRLFEFGKSYHQYHTDNALSKTYTEQNHLCITLSGNKLHESWRTQKGGVAHHFFDLKELADLLLSKLNLHPTNTEFTTDHPHWDYCLQYKWRKKVLVQMGAVRTSILRSNDIKQAVFFANFDWDGLLEQIRQQADLRFVPVSKYPSVRRDLALLIDRSVTFEQISQLALRTAKTYLQHINLFDVFEDAAKLGADKKSYAVSFVLQDKQKTLTDTEIDTTMKKIQQLLEKELDAQVR